MKLWIQLLQNIWTVNQPDETNQRKFGHWSLQQLNWSGRKASISYKHRCCLQSVRINTTIDPFNNLMSSIFNFTKLGNKARKRRRHVTQYVHVRYTVRYNCSWPLILFRLFFATFLPNQESGKGSEKVKMKCQGTEGYLCSTMDKVLFF